MRKVPIGILVVVSVGALSVLGNYVRIQREKAQTEHLKEVTIQLQMDNIYYERDIEKLRVENDQLDIDIAREQGKRPTKEQLDKLAFDKKMLESTESTIKSLERSNEFISHISH